MYKLLCRAMVLSLLLVFSGGTVVAAEKQIKMRLGHVLDQNSTRHKAAAKFAELAAAKTNGAITVDLYPSSQLGNERDLLEGVQMGTVDAVITGDIISNFYDPLGLFGLPYMFNSLEHLRKIIYGDIGESIKEGIFKQADIVALEFMERGAREVTSNFPVNSVKDVQGLKIRVPEIPLIVESWKAMGANPTPMAFGELYTALQQKTIDAQENPFVDIASGKLHEVQSHIAMTDHMFGYAMLSISSKTWKKFTPEQQKLLREAAKEARDYQNGLLVEVDNGLEKMFTEKGIVFTQPDKNSFIEKVQPVHKKYAQKLGQELYDKIVAAGK